MGQQKQSQSVWTDLWEEEIEYCDSCRHRNSQQCTGCSGVELWEAEDDS